ncbi:hypothetical protein Nepgr_006159 [Nepenthes gracilis]|uniref:Uncharacterized protein n=1 Tax=Nepenthes gracilis TaxID=150966 RepID=A0AAD3XH52_NEPGR|nr:hypothetical protein Nepgr_006159 [Nepenthes gracilis]
MSRRPGQAGPQGGAPRLISPSLVEEMRTNNRPVSKPLRAERAFAAAAPPKPFSLRHHKGWQKKEGAYKRPREAGGNPRRVHRRRHRAEPSRAVARVERLSQLQEIVTPLAPIREVENVNSEPRVPENDEQAIDVETDLLLRRRSWVVRSPQFKMPSLTHTMGAVIQWTIRITSAPISSLQGWKTPPCAAVFHSPQGDARFGFTASLRGTIGSFVSSRISSWLDMHRADGREAAVASLPHKSEAGENPRALPRIAVAEAGRIPGSPRR